MQQSEKAAAKAKAQCRRGFHLKTKARVIQSQFVDAVAQIFKLRCIHRKQATENHRLRRFKARQSHYRLLIMTDCIAHACITHLFDGSSQKANFAGVQFVDHFHLRTENSNTVNMMGCVIGHKLNPFTLFQLPIDDPHQDDHAQIRIIPAVHQHRFQRCIDVALRRGQTVHDGLKGFNNPLTGFSRNPNSLTRINPDHIFNLLCHPVAIGRRQVNLIQDRHNLMIRIQSMVNIRQSLSFHTLRAVYNQ